jgi:hypothetical protein
MISEVIDDMAEELYQQKFQNQRKFNTIHFRFTWISFRTDS